MKKCSQSVLSCDTDALRLSSYPDRGSSACCTRFARFAWAFYWLSGRGVPVWQRNRLERDVWSSTAAWPVYRRWNCDIHDGKRGDVESQFWLMWGGNETYVSLNLSLIMEYRERYLALYGHPKLGISMEETEDN